MSTPALHRALRAIRTMHARDADAMEKLMSLHVVSNSAVCTCLPTHAKPREDYPAIKLMGTLEVVNAICATPDRYIAAVYDASGTVIDFRIELDPRARSRPRNLRVRNDPMAAL